MSRMHAPIDPNPHDVSAETNTQPERTCPLCGDTTRSLPDHIRGNCEGV